MLTHPKQSASWMVRKTYKAATDKISTKSTLSAHKIVVYAPPTTYP
ncbi:hypothetical protein QUF58_14000 [Anaerolineales bacterium HSG24]|nr:hypothetical protein [Anaerolineales bacterium HSG24]